MSGRRIAPVVACGWLLATGIPAGAQDAAADRRNLLAHVADRTQVPLEFDGEALGRAAANPDEAELRALAEALTGDDWSVREDATRRILDLGWPAVTGVAPLVGGDPEPNQRLAMIRKELANRRDLLHGLLDALVADWGRWETAPDGTLRVVSGGARRAAPEDLRERLEGLAVERVDVENTPVRDAFGWLEEHGIEVLIARDVAENHDLRISLKLSGLSAANALEILTSIGQIDWSVRGGAVVIRRDDDDEDGPVEVVHPLAAGAEAIPLARWLQSTIAPGEWTEPHRMALEARRLVIRHRPEVQVRVRRALRGLGVSAP